MKSTCALGKSSCFAFLAMCLKVDTIDTGRIFGGIEFLQKVSLVCRHCGVSGALVYFCKSQRNIVHQLIRGECIDQQMESSKNRKHLTYSLCQASYTYAE